MPLTDEKMKVLLISDKPNWAYASIANAIIKYNNTNIILDHISCKGKIKKVRRLVKEYDRSFVLGWQNSLALNLDKSKTIVGIHSHQSFDNKQTTPDKDIVPEKSVIKYLSKFRSVNTVSRRLQSLFEKSGLKTIYTPNGVDIDMFSPVTKPDKFIVSSAGAIKNDWNKGIRHIVFPVCRELKIPLIHATDKKNISHDKMSSIYNKSICYICVSRSEGMSLSILEAASCGCVIVSTRCGDIEQLIKDGQNGLLIDRNKSGLSKALLTLKNNKELCYLFSKNVRHSIEMEWSWRHRVKAWLDFIRNS